MSRDSTPFNVAGVDACLPSIEHGEIFGGYDQFLEGDDAPIFLSTFDNDVLDDLNLGLDDGTIAPANSHAASDIATPRCREDTPSPEIDIGDYDFEQTPQAEHMYDGPGVLEEGTHPYPLHFQPPPAPYQALGKRPPPYRSATNANMDYVPSPLENFNHTHHPPHRRSWSQNDTERLANLPGHQYPPQVHPQVPYLHSSSQSNTNPTFVRLCETRHPRATTKVASGFKKTPHAHGRAGTRNTTNPPTSMPVAIGTPLPSNHQLITTAGNLQLTGPKMVHMSHGEQRTSSQLVIEIGAMAVLSKAKVKDKASNIDPWLMEEGAGEREKSDEPSPESVVAASEPREKMLRDLTQLEKLLKEGGEGEDGNRALKGCEMIREALAMMEDKGGRNGNGNESYTGYSLVADDKAQVSSPASSDKGSPQFHGNESLCWT